MIVAPLKGGALKESRFGATSDQFETATPLTATLVTPVTKKSPSNPAPIERTKVNRAVAPSPVAIVWLVAVLSFGST